MHLKNSLFLLLFICNLCLASARPIIIGVPTSLKTIEGMDAWRAVQLAVYEINKKGGVRLKDGYHMLKAYSIDTRGAEAGVPVYDAIMAIEKLILEKRPDAIIVGASRSEVLLASMDLIARYRIPYICTIALSSEFQKRIKEDYSKYKYLFRMGIDSGYVVSYFKKFISFLEKTQRIKKKAYIIVQDVLWTRQTGSSLKEWLEKNKWKVYGFDVYPMGTTDFSSSLFKIKSSDSKLLLIFFDMPEAEILIKQLYLMKIKAVVTGIISPAAPEYAWEVTDGAVEGIFGFILEAGSIPVKKIPKSLEFYNAYKRFWGSEKAKRLSCHGAANSYDAVYVLKEAMERAGELDPEKIVKEIERTDMFGAVGRIRFSKFHQLIFSFDPKQGAIACIFQWKKPGIRVPVFPVTIAEGRIDLP